MADNVVRQEPLKDEFGRCTSCGLKDYHAKGCDYWVVESYVVTIFSPTSYTEEQVAEIIKKALEAAGSDLQCKGASFGWKL